VGIVDKPGGAGGCLRILRFERNNHRVEFRAKIGRPQRDQSFFLDDMVFEGKREL
jgi:hypothetical protein